MHPGKCRNNVSPNSSSPKVSAQVQYPVRIPHTSTNSNTTNKKPSCVATPLTEQDLRPGVQRRFKRSVCSNQKLTVVAIVTVGVRFYHACAEEVALKPQNCSLGSSQTVGLAISEQTVTELRGEGTVTCLLLTFKWTCSRCRAQHNQRASELWCLIKQLWTFRRCFIFALCVLCGKS